MPQRPNIQNLLVRPPFYDALSGEFVPLSDPASRAHSLARLAFGAYAKGESRVRPTGSNRPLITRRYEPSWAPGIVATAGATTNGQTNRLIMLELESSDGRQLTVEDTSTFSGFSLELRAGETPPQRFKHLEEFRATTRQAVAEVAELFFNHGQTTGL